MATTKESTRKRRSYNPPVAGLRVLGQERTIWFRNLLADTDRVTIGRTRQRDLRLRDDTVSRDHCDLVRESDGSFHLIDRDSTNGLYVSRRGKYGRFPPTPPHQIQTSPHLHGSCVRQ